MTGPTGAPAVEARSLHRFFRAGDEETQALVDVSLQVLPGEFVAVVGESGSGKSTLLNCLGGLDTPDGGTVTVAGARLSDRPERERTRLRARHVGVLRQSGNLIEHLTVAQNVAVAQRLVPRRPHRDIDALLDSVGLAHRRNSRPSRLSGGEAARAGLAVAVANTPEVLLADEPTGELDSGTEKQVVHLLRALATTGTAIVLASHAPAVTGSADRRVVLVDGRIGTEGAS